MSTVSSSLAAEAAGAPPRFDFPTWLPPMLVKELRQGLRTRGFVGSLIIFQSVMVITFMWALAADVGGGVSMAQGFFWGLLAVVLLVVTPLRALAGLRSELDTRTIDLLLLTRLTAWRIVFGKWASLMIQALLLVATMLPYAVVRYFFGAVDVVNDLVIIGAMTAGCAVLTAAGLWASGLPKVVRILLMIGSLFVVPQMLSFGFFRHMGGSMFSGGGIEDWQGWTIALWTGAVGLFFGLVQAVRWLAPTAENHAPAARLAPLAMFLPAVLFLACSAQEAAGAQLVCAGVAVAFVAALELTATGTPMAIHLRTRRGGALGRWWVRWLALPGWPSAALFLAFGLVVLFGLGLWFDKQHGLNLPVIETAWVMVLGWGALVAPALALSLIPSLAKSAAAVYFILHGAFGIVAAMAGNHVLGGSAHPLAKALDKVSQCMPVTSFWHTLANLNETGFLTPAVFTMQVLMMAGVIMLTWWRANGYWTETREFARRAAVERAGKS